MQVKLIKNMELAYYSSSNPDNNPRPCCRFQFLQTNYFHDHRGSSKYQQLAERELSRAKIGGQPPEFGGGESATTSSSNNRLGVTKTWTQQSHRDPAGWQQDHMDGRGEERSGGVAVPCPWRAARRSGGTSGGSWGTARRLPQRPWRPRHGSIGAIRLELAGGEEDASACPPVTGPQQPKENPATAATKTLAPAEFQRPGSGHRSGRAPAAAVRFVAFRGPNGPAAHGEEEVEQLGKSSSFYCSAHPAADCRGPLASVGSHCNPPYHPNITQRLA